MLSSQVRDGREDLKREEIERETDSKRGRYRYIFSLVISESELLFFGADCAFDSEGMKENGKSVHFISKTEI